jgi:hypothetical protein
LISAALIVLPKLWPGVATPPVEQAVEFVPATTSVTPPMFAPTPGNGSIGPMGTATPNPPPTSLPPTTITLAVPTVITSPTEDIVAQSTAIANAVVVFADDFSSNTKGWFEDQDSNDQGDYSIQIADGSYHWTAKSTQNYSLKAWIPDLVVRDFRLSLEAKIIEASDVKDTYIAIEFRENERGDYYLLLFGLDHTYELWLWKNDKWRRLHQASGNGSFNLEPGVSNTFELVAAGSQFTIYANNHLLTTVANSELNEPGTIWLSFRLRQAEEILTADFDNLKIAEIPLTKTKPEIETTATAVVVATATARAASTATEVAHATAEANAIAEAVILFQDDFSTNSQGWWTGKYEDTPGLSEFEIVGGKYRQILKSKDDYSFVTIRVPGFSSKDFWLQVEATLVETSAQAGNAGVIIRFRRNQIQTQYYQVTFTNYGTFQVGLWQNEKWTTLQDWIPSQMINLEPGVPNTFAILIKGSIFTFYANGQKLTTVTDIALGEAGEIDLGIDLNEADQTLTVDFDNLVIKAAP